MVNLAGSLVTSVVVGVLAFWTNCDPQSVYIGGGEYGTTYDWDGWWEGDQVHVTVTEDEDGNLHSGTVWNVSQNDDFWVVQWD